MKEIRQFRPPQTGGHRSPNVNGGWADIIQVPLALRMVAMIFVFSTILDSFTFPFLTKSDNIAKLVGLVLAGLFLVFRAFRQRFRDVDIRLFLVFFVITVLEEGIRYTTLEPAMAAYSLRNYISYVQVFALYVIIRDVSKDPRVFRGIMAVFFLTYLGGALLTGFGLQIVTEEQGAGRVGLVGVNLNGFAFSLAVVVVGGLSWALSRWPYLGWKGWAFVSSLVFLLPALAVTGSRGGAVALVFGLLTAIVANMKVRRLPVFVFLVPLILGGVLLVLARTEVMQRRIQATLYEQDFGSRDRLAEAAVVLARRHPLIGVGPGYAKELGRIMGWGRIAAHNTYLQVILSFGLLGFLPFLGGFTMILRGAWRVRGSPWGGIWFAILAMTFAFAIVGNMGYNKSFWIILALGANAPLMAVVAGRNRGLVKQTVAPAVRGFRRGSLVCDIPPDDGRTGFKESSSQGGSKCR